MREAGGRLPAPPESGFALLLVFLMAAAIAISLYWQIPRVAFQAQRQKEQLLIERGEQYRRAIQLFVRVNGRYPAKVEDLENFNNRRFLRHRFVDPMTGKTEWRFIHINAAGVFTDSVANKKKGQENASASQNTFVGEQAYLAPDVGQGRQGAPGAATRRRESEGGAAPVGADGQPLFGAGAVPPPNAGPGVAPPPFPGAGGQLNPGGQPGVPGAAVPGIPGQPDQQTANQQLIQGMPFPPGQAQPAPAGPAGFNGNAPYPGVAVPDAIANPNGINSPAQPPRQLPGTLQSGLGQPGFQSAGGTQQPGVFAQPGQAGFQPGQAGFQPGQANQGAATTSSSFVGSSSSFVGSSQSFVGGGGSTSSGASPVPANLNPIPAPGGGGLQVGQPNFPQPNLQNPAFGQPAGQFTNQPAQFNNQGAQFNQTANQPVSQAGATSGFQPNPATQNAAAGLINGILTNPRPGGPGSQPGQAGPQGQQGQQGQQIGAGIAGVASTAEAPAIMVYNDHTNYNEWEFIYDFSKQKPLANPNGVPGTPAQALGSPAGATGAQAGAGGLPGSLIANPQPGGVPSAPAGIGTSPSPFGAAPGSSAASGTNPGTPGQNTAGGLPGQQQSPLPPGFRLGRP